jgi:hypothetical protein
MAYDSPDLAVAGSEARLRIQVGTGLLELLAELV